MHVARVIVIGGLTTRAAPPTMSGKVKKNGLATPPVRATSIVATVIATEPSSANFAGAGLGSTNSALCRPRSCSCSRAASRALPAIAAAQSACIARGATLAVTLTLPCPPSSISATAVPSSPE